MGLNLSLAELKSDPLYHFGFDKNVDLVEDLDLKGVPLDQLFGDTRMICMGGSASRARAFAKKLATEFDVGLDPDNLKPMGKTERFELYKIGPIISVNHGMAVGSVRIAMHELIKLLFYAGNDTRKVVDQTEMIRIGTSGGIGTNVGDVILSDKGINSRTLKAEDEIYRVGRTYAYPAIFDEGLRDRILATRGDIDVIVGSTLTSNCFYEEEPNIHGALENGYTWEDLLRDVETLKKLGAKNVEMEAGPVAAIGLRAGIPTADVCTVLDPIGVPITSSEDELASFCDNAQEVLLRYIRSRADELFPIL
jgi:uridine phosphorylase